MSCHLKWWHRSRPSGFLDYGHETNNGTEYVDTYKRHNVGLTESFKPAEEMRKTDAKVSDLTTFRIDYHPHPLTKHEPHPPEIYQPPETPMEGVTMYAQDYPGHRSQPAILTRRRDTRSVPLVKFEANPTYQSDFKRWSLPPRIKCGPNQDYKKPEVKMENTSTFQRDFIHRYQPPRESARPPDVVVQSGIPLESTTVHSMSFVPHVLEPRAQREKVKYRPPSVPMDTGTTFRLDFQGKSVPLTESMRPAQTAFISKDPISSSSEFRDSFVAWPTLRPQRHEPARYMTPEGQFDHRTTQRLDFRQLNGRPASVKRPAAKKSQSMPFDGTTNYGVAYKKWNVPRTLGKPRQESLNKSGKFEGMSTTKLHYIAPAGANPAKSCKPDNRVFLSDTAIDDNTIYKSSYIPQSMKEVERYPTPDWLKQQQDMWKRQGMYPKCGGMTPAATRTVEVGA